MFDEIKEILNKYYGRGKEFEKTLDLLCSKGIFGGGFPDYAMLSDILVILAICYHQIIDN